MASNYRNRAPSPKPDEVDWKRALENVLDRHNSMHANKKKAVSHRTRDQRARGLFRIFSLLHSMGFQLTPQNLGARHITYLVRYWLADEALEPDLRRQGMRMDRFAKSTRQLSPEYIQQMLSMLRVFAVWIGKPGMVLAAAEYVDEQDLVKCHATAQHDLSWPANVVGIGAAIAAVGQIDSNVALQLEVMLAFGLTRQQATVFNPALAEVPAHALPANAAPDTPYLMFVRVKRGANGGRLRFTAVRNDFQRTVLERPQAAARDKSSHIGVPGRSLKQALDRFDYVMRRAGITRSTLGVTPHGRHYQFTSDLYVELKALPPPMAGGSWEDAAQIKAVYLEVARQLGNGRLQNSAADLWERRMPAGGDGQAL